MKANPRRIAPPIAPRPFLAPLIATLALGACVAPPAQPPRAPTQPPAQAPQRPSLPPPVSSDWRDAPATPGRWRWNQGAIGATASFAGGLLTIGCNRAAATVSILRADTGHADQPVTVTISTTESTRNLTARRVAGGIETTLPARDRLLDAMAFSRGRFEYAAAGTQTLYVPSWTEISRVVEDCR